MKNNIKTLLETFDTLDKEEVNVTPIVEPITETVEETNENPPTLRSKLSEGLKQISEIDVYHKGHGEPADVTSNANYIVRSLGKPHAYFDIEHIKDEYWMDIENGNFDENYIVKDKYGNIVDIFDDKELSKNNKTYIKTELDADYHNEDENGNRLPSRWYYEDDALIDDETGQVYEISDLEDRGWTFNLEAKTLTK